MSQPNRLTMMLGSLLLFGGLGLVGSRYLVEYSSAVIGGIPEGAIAEEPAQQSRGFAEVLRSAAQSEASPVEVSVYPRQAQFDAMENGSQSFELPVTLQVEPGWHIYWLNPGEIGKPTRATFPESSGVERLSVRWPAPERFDQAMGMVGYGYQSLVAPIVTGILKSTQKASFALAFEWLACNEDRCIPGQAELPVDLKRKQGATGASVPEAAQGEYPIPLSFEESKEVKRYSKRVVGDGLEIKVQWEDPVTIEGVFGVQQAFGEKTEGESALCGGVSTRVLKVPESDSDEHVSLIQVTRACEAGTDAEGQLVIVFRSAEGPPSEKQAAQVLFRLP